MTLECNKTNMLKLAEALESGEFQQATGSLRHGDGFCCLGVACELHRRETGEGLWERGDGCLFYMDEQNYLPAKVSLWLGLDPTGLTDDIDLFNGEELAPIRVASHYNDCNTPFPKIAAMIRHT